MASPSALRALADALEAEQARRRARIGAKGGDARERLIAELEVMAERARASPGWVEPTEEERRQGLAEIEDWLRAYMQS